MLIIIQAENVASLFASQYVSAYNQLHYYYVVFAGIQMDHWTWKCAYSDTGDERKEMW